MRIRCIRPDTWASERFGSWPPYTRLLALALDSLADDQGRLRAAVPYLKAQVFPFDTDLDVASVLRPLLDCRHLVLYRVAGETFGLLPDFLGRQVINRPTKSHIPDPPHDLLTDCSLSTHGALNEPSLPEGEREGEVEVEKEKEKEPPMGVQGVKGVKVKPRKQSIEAFSPQVKAVVNALHHDWPREDRDGGRAVNVSIPQWAGRVAEILSADSAITPELLIEAARSYLSEHPAKWKAPQFFFGPGGPGETAPWRPYAEHLITISTAKAVPTNA